MYSCSRCNSAKRDNPVADPTRIAFGKCLLIDDMGGIEAINDEGRVLIKLLHLDGPRIVKIRERFLRLLKWKSDSPNDPRVDELFLEAFGYPVDLPNLKRKRPPGGNARKKAAARCHYELRRLNQLARTY